MQPCAPVNRYMISIRSIAEDIESLKIEATYSSILLADALVIPVLEVLVNGSLLRVLVLAHHGREAGLLEVGITDVVLSFEGDGVGGGNHVEDVRVFEEDRNVNE